MHYTLKNLATGLFLALLLGGVAPLAAEAQGRGKPDSSVSVSAGVTFSVELKTQIRDFYSARPATEVAGLPPGIRRKLERGKPLPPGIAKKYAPEALRVRVALDEGYELVEVGVDVFLVEVATHVIHDVLMDVIR